MGSFLVVAFVSAFGLSQMKPPPNQEEVGTVELLVEVATLQSGRYDFTIESQGTVRPLTETILSAEVSGAIVSVSPKFLSGGVFAAGATSSVVERLRMSTRPSLTNTWPS